MLYDCTLIEKKKKASRISNDIDRKLGPVTKINKKNMTTSKKNDYDLMSTNCDVIVIFPIYGQYGAIRKRDSGRMAVKTYIFIKVTFYLTNIENRSKKSLTKLSY